jgi:RNA polymerase sigma factor (sigma-70 family)
MTAKVYLSQVIESEKEIASLLSEIERLRVLKYSIGSAFGEEGERKRKDNDPAYVKIIAQIDEHMKTLYDKIKEQSRMRDQIHDTIESVKSSTERRVLRYVYICGMTIEETARKMAYSERQLKRIHKRALSKIKPN